MYNHAAGLDAPASLGPAASAASAASADAAASALSFSSLSCSSRLRFCSSATSLRALTTGEILNEELRCASQYVPNPIMHAYDRAGGSVFVCLPAELRDPLIQVIDAPHSIPLVAMARKPSPRGALICVDFVDELVDFVGVLCDILCHSFP